MQIQTQVDTKNAGYFRNKNFHSIFELPRYREEAGMQNKIYFHWCCYVFLTSIFLNCQKAIPQDATNKKHTLNNEAFPEPDSQGNCPPQYVLEHGACFQECNQQNPCPKEFYCFDERLCISNACQSNEQCPKDYLCDNNKHCVPSSGCDDNNDCPKEYICSLKHECVSDHCQTSDDCPQGHVCSNEKICISDNCSDTKNCPQDYWCSASGICVPDECDPQDKEQCKDSFDNNCNGFIDELDPACQTDTTCQGEPPLCGNTGVCAQAKRPCVTETYISCDLTHIVTYQSTEQNCGDSLDNDCDSLIDYQDPDCGCDPETAPDVACKFSGIGVCATTYRKCINSVYEPESVCDYGKDFVGASNEITGVKNIQGQDVCNDTLDNDCDGNVDECCPFDSCIPNTASCKNSQELSVCKNPEGSCPAIDTLFCEFGCENNACKNCLNPCIIGKSTCINDNEIKVCEIQANGCPDYSITSCKNGCAHNECKPCQDDPLCNTSGNICKNNTTQVTCIKNSLGCFETTNETSCNNGICSSITDSCCINDTGCTIEGTYCLDENSEVSCSVDPATGCLKKIVTPCQSNKCSSVINSCCTNTCTTGDKQCINGVESQICEMQSNGCLGWTTSSCILDSVSNLVSCGESYQCPCGLQTITTKNFRGDFFNLPCTHPDIEPTDTSKLGIITGDSPFNHDWFDQKYYVFSLDRNDLQINYNLNYFPVNTGLCEDPYYFAVHWHTFIDVTTAGDFTFELGSDDDGWLYIDGVKYIDNGGIHPITSIQKNVTLSQGPHKIDIYFAERKKVQSGLVFHVYPVANSSYTLGIKTCVVPSDDADNDSVANHSDCAPLDPLQSSNCGGACLQYDACTLNPNWNWYCDKNLQPKECAGPQNCRFKTTQPSAYCLTQSCSCPSEDLP